MLHIEISVSREPGSLSVSSYSDYDTRTLADAIAEAEAFIAQCRAIQADMAAHGLGEREPRPPLPAHLGQIAADTFAEAATGAEACFASPALFHALRTRR